MDTMSAGMAELRRRDRNTALLCAVCILINLCISWLASAFGLSLYLDSIGTILAAALGGILPGVVTGFVTNLLKGLWDLSSIYYIPINIGLHIFPTEIVFCAFRTPC